MVKDGRQGQLQVHMTQFMYGAKHQSKRLRNSISISRVLPRMFQALVVEEEVKKRNAYDDGGTTGSSIL